MLRTRARGGRFVRGARFGPVRRVRVEPFRIDATAVTNARFADFVRAT
ncbi:SUMF1/EgtB/PvdO family nonheme iron enzyme [Streptomyces mirabilis]